MSMHCQQVGNRIEITSSLNPFFVKSNDQFIRSLDDPKYLGFDTVRIVWSVLDTPDTRLELRGRGCIVLAGDRDCTDMLADLDRLTELLR